MYNRCGKFFGLFLLGALKALTGCLYNSQLRITTKDREYYACVQVLKPIFGITRSFYGVISKEFLNSFKNSGKFLFFHSNDIMVVYIC